MTRRPTSSVPCPICKKPVKLSDTEAPFCSERCRTLDLANWADGKYVISNPAPDLMGSESEGDE